ncbi:MAG: hypothetical protein K8S97_02155, partial [Anaerolineae bacterium]|nr:hypothetical protein [Anaerolineae bacterium]
MSDASSPKNAAVLIKRASSAYNASNFDQAIEHSRAALIMLGGMEDEVAQELLDQAYERLTMSYQRIGNYNTAMDVVAEWEMRAQRDESRVRAKIQHSRVENYLGNYDVGMRLADEAGKEAQQAGMTLEQGIAKRVRADMLWKRGRPEDALKLGKQAVALLEQTGALEPQAGARVTMAAAYHSSGQ